MIVLRQLVRQLPPGFAGFASSSAFSRCARSCRSLSSEPAGFLFPSGVGGGQTLSTRGVNGLPLRSTATSSLLLVKTLTPSTASKKVFTFMPLRQAAPAATTSTTSNGPVLQPCGRLNVNPTDPLLARTIV